MPDARRWGAAAAVTSVLTMPLTAVWFLFLGFGVLIVAALSAARDEERKDEILEFGGFVGFGLLVGPAIYLTLAVF